MVCNKKGVPNRGNIKLTKLMLYDWIKRYEVSFWEISTSTEDFEGNLENVTKFGYKTTECGV